VIADKGNFVSVITLNYKLLCSTGIEYKLRNLSTELTPPVEVFSFNSEFESGKAVRVF
jgi:hypothetical protein